MSKALLGVCSMCGIQFFTIGCSPNTRSHRRVCGSCHYKISLEKAGEVVKDAVQVKNLNSDSEACSNCKFYNKKIPKQFWAPCLKGKISDQQEVADGGKPGLVYFLDVCGDFDNGL
jgi:hypothetical protein